VSGRQSSSPNARAAVDDRGRFTFAVSGGHTPWAMFAALAGADMPWDEVTIFQVDERVAPAGDPDRNLTHLRESLPAAAKTDIHPMPLALLPVAVELLRVEEMRGGVRHGVCSGLRARMIAAAACSCTRCVS
jgi:6-phosphogluconolactonase/glucosamine-6-phosphate isomerase/deaminase